MSDSKYEELVLQQRRYFCSGGMRSYEARVAGLKKLRAGLVGGEGEVLAALKEDLGKSGADAYAGEIGFVLAEIDFALRHLKGWMKGERVKGPWFSWPSRGRVVREGFGVVLILSPWNYPVQLLMGPLVGAIAGGNCVVVKPSELAPRTAEVMRGVIKGAFGAEQVACVTGGVEAAEGLLRERFDMIFYTGSTAVGKKVMAAAAAHLTPVVLELGGKCPCIVHSDANVKVAARRVVWGKMMNAGQTCVAPDFVMVQERVFEAFVAECKRAVEAFYGAEPEKSADFGRIVNAHHVRRLAGYLEGATVLMGGRFEEGTRYFSPTLVTGELRGKGVMEEEIFGPILPILPYRGEEEAVGYLKGRGAPLAVYLFTESEALVERVGRELRSGGLCVNDVVVQIFAKGLPFGGVGVSGMGRYHGRASFECFTYSKSILRCRTRPEFGFRYPPARLTVERLRPVIRFLLRR